VIEEDDVAGWLVADLLDASGFDDVPRDQEPLD